MNKILHTGDYENTLIIFTVNVKTWEILKVEHVNYKTRDEKLQYAYLKLYQSLLNIITILTNSSANFPSGFGLSSRAESLLSSFKI